MPGVSIRQLVKRFGDVNAVDHVDLEIADGELLVLLGPSGCGKTTTLRCIAGLEEISDGEIRIGDRVVSSRGYSLPSEKRAIGMVFQSYAIWPHMSVRQNVAFGLKLKSLSKAEINRRVDATLDMVGLTGLGERGASQLSGGQQQRVAVARAVTLEPQILLFDEPLSNLDARLRERMRFELRELQRRLGITAVYVTHDQQEAMALADRIVLMNKGRIEQAGSPTEIYHCPASLFAAGFVGLTNVLPGRLSRSSDAARVALDGGEVSLVAANAGLPQLTAQSAQGDNAFAARVVESVFLGSTSEHEILLGTHRLRVQISPSAAWRVGDTVWVRIDPEQIVLLPRSGA
jgi:ABC-type Fe3+/spermidine/putrescine transport system ATPase subunit